MPSAAPVVELIAYTPEPELVCAAAAKLAHEPDDFPKGKSFVGMMNWLRSKPEHIEKVLHMCLDRGEGSVTEHVSFTFYLGGVSRVLTHELVRHRIASYTQQSQRFVAMDEPTFVRPDSIGMNIEAASIFDAFMEQAWMTQQRLKGLGIDRQDARFVLPNACTTKIVVTMNTRSLHNLFNQRCDPHAQWEIRGVAKQMLLQVKAVAPLLFYQYEVCKACGVVTTMNSIEPHENRVRCRCEKAAIADRVR